MGQSEAVKRRKDKTMATRINKRQRIPMGKRRICNAETMAIEHARHRTMTSKTNTTQQQKKAKKTSNADPSKECGEPMCYL